MSEKAEKVQRKTLKDLQKAKNILKGCITCFMLLVERQLKRWLKGIFGLFVAYPVSFFSFLLLFLRPKNRLSADESRKQPHRESRKQKCILGTESTIWSFQFCKNTVVQIFTIQKKHKHHNLISSVTELRNIDMTLFKWLESFYSVKW